jgi:hypothetical protein
MDSNRKWRWQVGGALALALAVPATLAQTRVEERVVTRPDGTVVYPFVSERETRGSSWWPRDRAVDADERERRRLETQRSAEERRELRAREREAALENPARQIPPTSGR